MLLLGALRRYDLSSGQTKKEVPDTTSVARSHCPWRCCEVRLDAKYFGEGTVELGTSLLLSFP